MPCIASLLPVAERIILISYVLFLWNSLWESLFSMFPLRCLAPHSTNKQELGAMVAEPGFIDLDGAH